MKSKLVLFVLICFIAVPVFASFDFNIVPGVIKSGDETAMKISLVTDYKEAPWGLGLNFNYIAPEDKKPADVDMVVLRYAEYDDGVWGLRLGILENMNYGYGLIMDNYSTNTQGSSLQSNSQLGLSFYTKAYPIGVAAFMARSNVYGVRLTESFWPDLVFGRPLILGQTFMADSDGVNTSTGVVGRGQAALGIDAAVPLIDNFWDVYSEAASLLGTDSKKNNVSGLSLGTIVQFSPQAKFNLRYISFEAGFVPGYFNSQYEVSPVDLSSTNTAASNGFLATLGLDYAPLFSFSGTYSSFKGYDASLLAVATSEMPNKVKVVVSYEQPKFGSLSDLSSNNANYKADLYYPMDKNMVIFHYKRIYLSGGVMDTSTSVEYQIGF